MEPQLAAAHTHNLRGKRDAHSTHTDTHADAEKHPHKQSEKRKHSHTDSEKHEQKLENIQEEPHDHDPAVLEPVSDTPSQSDAPSSSSSAATPESVPSEVVDQQHAGEKRAKPIWFIEALISSIASCVAIATYISSGVAYIKQLILFCGILPHCPHVFAQLSVCLFVVHPICRLSSPFFSTASLYFSLTFPLPSSLHIQ